MNSASGIRLPTVSPVLFHHSLIHVFAQWTSCTNGPDSFSSLYACSSGMMLHCLLTLTFDLSTWLLLDQQECWHMWHRAENAQSVLLMGVLPLHHENMPRLAFFRLNRTEIRVRLPQSSWLRQLRARRVLNIWLNPTRWAKTNLGQLNSRASWKMCLSGCH